MIIKRDPNGAAGGAPANPAASSTANVQGFDPASFKTEILNNNKALLETAMGTMQNMFNETLTRHNQERQQQEEERSNASSSKTHPIMTELADEMTRLGIKDPDQAEALVSVVSKAIQKTTPELESKIVKTVDSNTTHKTLKANYDQEAISKFPDIRNQTSNLFFAAQKIYKEMSPALQKEPDAMSIAVHRAASQLGIQPTAPVEIAQGEDAGNPTGGGGGGGPRTASKADMEFAATFGVNPEQFQKRFAEVTAKKGR